jgi:hypothetical protein
MSTSKSSVSKIQEPNSHATSQKLKAQNCERLMNSKVLESAKQKQIKNAETASLLKVHSAFRLHFRDAAAELCRKH